MAASMTKEQASVRNADLFKTQLSVLHDAAVGVIVCRTREPFRAIDNIKQLALANKLPLHMWTVLNGWSTVNVETGAQGAGDGMKDPNMALQKIDGLDGGSGMGDGFFAYMYPQHFVKAGQSNPAMLQCIKEYCRSFSQTESKRLVLIAPIGYALPHEWEDDVTILDFDVPSFAELSETLRDQIADLPATKRPKLEQDDMDHIVAAGSGMTAHEFENSLARSLVLNRTRLPGVTGTEIGREVMNVKIEVVKRSEVLEVMEVADMSEVGGLDNLKDWVKERVGCFGQEAADAGIEAPKGIALIGPPGTGKSLLAKAVASLLRLPLLKFDVSRVFQGLVGASEERVRATLKMLDAMAPCVAMLDEVDKAFQLGAGGDSGISQRVLGAILTHMQESDAPIFWIATANRTNNLPAEFLRRGRLDEVFSVSVPDAAERMEVLRIHLKKRKTDPDTVTNLDAAVAGSEGFVPAELEAAVKDAKIKSFTHGVPMSGELIAEQLSNMKPLSVAFAEQFQQMQTWADENARAASRSQEVRVAAARPRQRVRPALTSARPTKLDADEPQPA